MLVVKVELHSAITRQVTTLGEMIIANDGTGTPARGNYFVRVGNKRQIGNHRAILTSPQRQGEVADYPRQSYSVWRLVARALGSAFPEERAGRR